ncbi:hypothetical protein MMC21_004836 [Puttea exsequens]|nr:hypothetical protein [Puttea exsequens]
MAHPVPAPEEYHDSLSHRFDEPPSVARTPSRRQQFTEKEINPLLSDLSPTSTLEALLATDAVPLEKRNRRQSFVRESVASASTSERAWGIKAALASKKLQDWLEQLSEWRWHGYDRGDAGPFQGDEYWGALAAKTILQYEEHIDIIRADMETLEVQDLKDHVRSTHISRAPTSSDSFEQAAAATDYDHLDDFTAIITATIVQALPTLSRLTLLLNTWSTRLLILRRVPKFLMDLGSAQESMVSAWLAISKPIDPVARRKLDFTRKSFEEIQAVLQDQISHLGRHLDTMLDLLEGNEDTLPNGWIDGMDDLESEYSVWVVRAEELAFTNELVTDVDGQSDEQGRAKKPSESLRNMENDSTPCHSDANALPKMVGVKPDPSSGRVPPANAARPPNNAPSGLSKSFEIDDRSLRTESETLFSESRSQDLSPSLSKVARRPPPLSLYDPEQADSTASSEFESDLSNTGSATSEYFSNKSSPEILNASVIEYIGSPGLKGPWSGQEMLTPPVSAPRRWSEQTERNESIYFAGLPSGPVSPNSQRSRASTLVPDGTIGTVDQATDGAYRGPNHGHVRTRSASMKSFEIVPKSEIRKIVVRRSDSYTSPLATARLASLTNRPSLPLQSLSYDGAVSTSPIGHDDSKMHSSVDDKEPSNDQQSWCKPSIPCSVPVKAQHRFEQVSDLDSGSTSVNFHQKRQNEPTSNPAKGKASFVPSSGKSIDDRLQDRISSILPTNIRLTKSTVVEAPETASASNFGVSKTPGSRVPSSTLHKSQTFSPPTLTLAPAESQLKSLSTKSSNGEPETKLYHLHQPGKEVPIKLFVRLVGEGGERVMVRIGGGWADLGEYLREYANRHGRRTASDSRFDIQGMPSSPLSSQAPISSRPNTPGSSNYGNGSTPNRGQTTPGKLGTPQTPASDPAIRPPSRSSTNWNGTEGNSPSLGLAGPKTKKVDISPSKQQWVDDMLDQARGNGSEKFGNLGKAGGIKRVFFKRKASHC